MDGLFFPIYNYCTYQVTLSLPIIFLGFSLYDAYHDNKDQRLRHRRSPVDPGYHLS